ncbi:MAG: Uma2 family endonuclease [Microcoleus sp. PH2017_29_MFU_D_A]|jgi:Uma2 family endonuclease|uniref:Uma2 family endonuclease n=1 Tax=unclassified Microcoleus TaxID=2642155 RepID=UPI001D354203|nr:MULTISPECIES: Uma2 family endonuclease [unclassified Microcoleus]MCC3422270.1 Uma2 family endonuclease [Microcoleus sp. PH2017_07_MST_O_A]MCC3433752.1 Uma2 family endonuclease [Microcoleus sp. PH2017_04_SCI_O_A]MCC3445119.1 Uma2 family endonuclease [Microcoleus sp. PH2017_03_ELD_O_A]MCC3505034.1 Uma2 family endonuclease [Microcoleus sp. PH2017_19_SFW_U_A]MCC3512794.1 Uma2 family endonuclease [Microcoleus sp. PH2017_17_BER_D_A]TAE07204.1 MAG: Uma2 family endonuclease [Oscillatoriales cyanob
MVQTKTKLTFVEFIEKYPDGSGIYELVNGEIVKVEATRAHKNVARFLVFGFNDEIRRLELDYIVDKDIVFRTVTARGQEQGRNPDVGVVKASVWNSNVRGYGALTEPIQLAVEVTSTNWEDDYVDKLDEYQRLGICEYWIVDYLAIASRAYLGNPKIPTVFVYSLENDRYLVQSFTGNERIISKTFPELEITVEQIVISSQMQNL